VISEQHADGAAPERDRRLAHEIARTSAQLGEALGDIVWALDARAGRLEELAARLAEHGNRLCAADDGPEFVADLPAEWSAPLLPLPVRRNVLAVGLEALHNASRHSGATRVRLGLRPAGDGRWELAVEDDGRGIANGNGAGAPRDGEPAATTGTRGTSPGSGRGLPGMRRRAEEIGAELTVGNGAGRGTVVRLRFPVEHHAG
jgi:signal transduction histidine kinase